MPPTERPPPERPAEPKQSQPRTRRGAQREIISSTVTKQVRPVIAPVTDQERRDLIALAAYYLAERRGFAPGHEEEDWIAAETQVGQLYEPPE